MRVAVTWQMCGYVDIDAPTMEEAMEKFKNDVDMIPLPEDGEYVDASFELSSDDPEVLKVLAEPPRPWTWKDYGKCSTTL